LQHPPIQGKAALQRLKNDLMQPSFPSSQASVSEFLDARYLKYIKSGLIDNLITVLLKVIIKQTEPDLIGKENTIIMCLVAIQIRYSQRFMDRMQQELPRTSDGCSDDELRRVMRLFAADSRCWSWLGKPNQVRITELVRNYDYDQNSINAVAECLAIDELRPLFEARAITFSIDQKKNLYSVHNNSVFIDDAITEYSKSRRYRDAEDLFDSLIRPFFNAFEAEHIISILNAAKNNSQIYGAGKTPLQLSNLFDQSIDLLDHTTAAWQDFLHSVWALYESIYSILLNTMILLGVGPIADPKTTSEILAAGSTEAGS
jgi:hypothetical protein